MKNRSADFEARTRVIGNGDPPPRLPILYEKIRGMINPVLIIGDRNVKETGRCNRNNNNEVRINFYNYIFC